MTNASLGAEFFDANDEDIEENEPLLQPLSWRGDASTTHSDWTVVIESNNKEEKKETYYPVHKAILGVGPRSSMYFSTLFASQHFKEQQDGGISRITLEESDAQVFPVVLDYIYDGTLAATTDNAVALRSLARYFHCQSLLKSINEFIQQDLSITTAPTYLVQAWERSDTKLETSSRQLILTHFENIDDHALNILPTPLFTSLWNHLQCDNHSMMSRVVYYFFQSHPEARNATLLSDLTSTITHMDVRVVSGFLELVAQLDPLKEKDDSWLALDHLCKKCADSLVTDWRLFDVELCVRKFLNPSVQGDFRGTGRIAVRLMGAGIEQAKADYTRVLEHSHQLQAAHDRQSSQIQAQAERIQALQESCRTHKESSKYKDLEISGLKIGIDKHKKRIKILEEQVALLQEQLVKASIVPVLLPTRQSPKKKEWK